MSSPNSRAALVIVDMQEDFCQPNGSLALPGGREIAPVINELLSLPGFTLKLAARDFHPADHVSFASQHSGACPFESKTTIENPENERETQTTTLWPDHCIQGTPGCDIIPEIHTERLDAIIEKGADKRVESYSAFGPPFRDPPVSMTGLDEVLKANGITHVFCAGLSYNVCVFHTAVDAAEYGYRTFVVRDATASRQTAEALAATSKALEEAGVVLIDASSTELDIAR